MREIDINDLPDSVRLKITSKRVMNNIENDFKVSLTVKGNYYPPGKQPTAPHERKLHMVVESNDPQAVLAAVNELNRQISQEANRMGVDQAYEHFTGVGKYRL